uniref:L-type lectin-domain containing receptor kinase IX.1-like n=1 Tax=Erigeron canadensis TaxID=72917 RepID=UPI001CB9D02F|nr:L-type lectin-domain containing receptor kinase IX.1-like [Erigeron canadensis]
MATSFCYSSCLVTKGSYILLFLSLFMLLFPLNESEYFNFDRFDAGDMSISYTGDAVVSVGAVELINRYTYVNRVGQAIYANPIPIWDQKSGKLTDFTTHFTFVIDIQVQSVYGHGLCFFLAPVSFQIPPNSGGGFLGLFNTTYTNSPQNQMIVVEFDSRWNEEWDPQDERGDHVGINRNSLFSANYTSWNASIHSGDPADVWVSYSSTTQMLDLRWSYGGGNDSDTNTSLSYQVNLREVLPEQAIVGISAATGSSGERTRHILQNWEFNSTLQMKKNSEDNSKEWKLAVGLTVPLSVLLVAAACIILVWKTQRKPTRELETVALTSMNDDLERGAGPKRFSYSDLVSATNNFSNDRKLGEGGFGCVYKGYLSREGIVVAVKKISQGSRQGKKEYITEVKIISSLRHRNLVRLIGWCHDQTQFLLVYEFMPNGSLDSHLFGQKSHIQWAVRYKIATGLASALLYLHEEWEQCVVHRDIKTSNIMLDSGFNAKLGDFGLARLMDHEMGPQTTGLAGTLGYLAPECVTTGKASKESDVYSFGVVALEIACGRKAMDSVDPNSDLGLVKWVWDLLGKGELLSGVDQKLNKEFDVKQVECLMKVGLWCAHPDRNLRPSIRQAIQVLKFEAAVPNLPMKMPVPIYPAAQDDPEVSSGAASVTYTSTDLIR